MNIFSNLKLYAAKWMLTDEREFTSEEKGAVETAVVVASEYGNSVCFHMKGGGSCYIPLSTDATLGIGETVDLNKAKLITLSRSGDEDIMRVKA